MKNIILVNAICALTLICIGVMVFFTPKIVVVSMFVLWLVFILYANYVLIVKQSDLIATLKSANRRGVFDDQVMTLANDYKAIQLQKQIYESYEEDSSIRKSYELILKKMESNITSAINFMNQYDYVNMPSVTYLYNIVHESMNLMSKLHELQELVLEINDSASDVDITYVDDMLESLRRISKNEKQD